MYELFLVWHACIAFTLLYKLLWLWKKKWYSNFKEMLSTCALVLSVWFTRWLHVCIHRCYSQHSLKYIKAVCMMWKYKVMIFLKLIQTPLAKCCYSIGFAGRNWVPMNNQLMWGSLYPVLPCDVYLDKIYADLCHQFQKNALVYNFCFFVP